VGLISSLSLKRPLTFGFRFFMRIDSWESQGTISKGQYSGDYGGVCSTYVEDQFSSGGHKLATK
jgi:hypothetical protein